MSKLLKVIVNTLLLLAILSAGALVIPPFAGITTLVSDGMGNTNISRGAVTYAKKTDTSSVATGDKILVDDNSGKYIYTIQSLDTAAGTASVKNVISGDTTEITVRATVSKVIVTIPVIGFLSMAAQSREGIMIIGLAILFLVILFILSEVWKRDEEEDEEEKEKYANEKKKKKRKNLSKFTTGMDDLLVRESYKFSEKGSLILEKGHIESDRSEILRSRNRALTRSITGLDNKLAGFPGYNPFITNKEVKVKSTDVKEGKVITIEKIENRPYLRISDLDMAAIFRRSSSRWNVIGKIAGTSNNDTIDIKYLCELNGLCKSLNSMDSIEHMTRADKLYVQIKIEKLLNYSALVCLWKNICELADSEYKVLFYDKESVKMLSDCFAMDNVIYRADFLNMEFESLKDYEELQEKEKNRVMDTWKTEIKDCLMKTIMRQNEEKENLTLNHWKDVYKEDVDIWANWAFPLFSSCFCVVLSKNILHKRLNGEKKQQQMIRIMYEELSEYINTNDVKLETMIMDENDFKVLAKNEIMLRAFSEYVRQALETIHKIKMPITLKEIDAMMPKKKQNFYLKYSKIQFLRRNEEALGSNINGITL